MLLALLLFLFLHSFIISCEFVFASEGKGARILFIHIPKTGGESIKNSLREVKGFTFWQHRAYKWDEYVENEVENSASLPKNLILEHHTKTKPISQIQDDLVKLKNLWDRRGLTHFEFIVVREPIKLHESLYSWCSKKLINKRKISLPKLWHNIVPCTMPNFMSSYLEDGRWGCGGQHKARNLTQSCDIPRVKFWLNEFEIYDLSELSKLRKDLNEKIIVGNQGKNSLIKPFSRANRSRILDESRFAKKGLSELSSINCRYSEYAQHKINSDLNKFSNDAPNGSSRVKKLRDLHVSCDTLLYDEIRLGL